MRLLLAVALLLPVCLSAQEKGGKGPNPFASPKNLKVLTGDTPEQLQMTMRAFAAALGQRCGFCHVQGDFASDDNPKKETARMMLAMARDINGKFPDGKRHVTCYTCHRGATEPATEPPPAPAQ
ncbi:MAG TPA: c-type cytochrome [Bryobacteraceae bacterium]|jgi:photosynthetic reaction center cytochrome c subunit|nr:c-type cytochrome [Bryobacteraceae bacterium]